MFLAVGSVSVVVLIIAGVFMWSQYKESAPGNGAPDTSDELSQEERELLGREATQKFLEIDEVNQVEAETLLAAAVTPEERSSAYMNLANSWSGRDNQKALDYAKQAVEEHESADTYMALASWASIAGDSDLAEEASKRAGELGAWAHEVE